MDGEVIASLIVSLTPSFGIQVLSIEFRQWDLGYLMAVASPHE
jgi:hypothetical protein